MHGLTREELGFLVDILERATDVDAEGVPRHVDDDENLLPCVFMNELHAAREILFKLRLASDRS